MADTPALQLSGPGALVPAMPHEGVTENLRGPATVGTAIFVLFFVVLGGLSTVVSLDSSVQAPGFVRVEANRQSVSHRDGGIVKELLVKEGSHVEKGDLLLRLNDVDLRATIAVLEGQRDAYLAIDSRLAAERDKLPRIKFDEKLTARKSDPNVAALMASQEQLFFARKQSMEAQIGVFEQRIAELGHQIEGYRSQYRSTDSQHRLINEELNGTRDLYTRGWAPKTKVMELQRNAAYLGGSRGEQQANIARSQQAIGEARMQIIQIQRDRVTEISDQLRDTQTRLFDVEPRLVAAQDQLSRTELRSPMAGQVVGLNTFTVGGVIAPGQKVMEIVPENAAYVLDGTIGPQFVDDVHVGQEANIRLEGVARRVVGEVKGKVTRVSADRVVDERTPQPYYTISVEVDPSEVLKTTDINLVPGMPVDISIPVRKRSAWHYIVYPFARSFDTEFRGE